jgi:hypothetical protein
MTNNMPLSCTTYLFYVLDPTCFGSSLPSSESFLDPSELLEIQIEWVVYHIICGYVTCVPECRGSVRDHDTPAHRPRNYTLYDIPPIRFVFQYGTTTIRHTGHVTTHYMIYHQFDLHFKYLRRI